MAKRKSNRREGNPQAPSSAPAQRELVFMSRSGAALRATPGGFESLAGAEVGGLMKALNVPGVRVEPLFASREEPGAESLEHAPEGEDTPELGRFFHVSAPDNRLEELADSLRALDEVEAAFVKPAGSPPIARVASAEGINQMAPAGAEPPSTTPDYVSRQLYLNPAPVGVDARYAWRFRGGKGAGVSVIDCEWGWRFTHEDLLMNQGGIVIGAGVASDDHGTAVIGEIGGDVTSFGVTGICADARVSAASFASLPTATVIQRAADKLRRGDIILLEIHRPGPGASGSGQDGFIAVEWWPDDFAAIRYAVARGILVVEAAGNGFRNLDDPIYNQPAPGFPSTWRNPFNPANPSSGAVVVGAGAPPPGTHGRDHGPDRSRLAFSNYGRRVDAQGWGREVTTTGYGDLQGGSNRDLWYTDQFSGTSSASPIIVGALGCLQGILKARSRPLLTPAAARQLLRATGSPQQDAPGRPRTQRIGNRPNLRQMVAHLLGTPAEENGVHHEAKDPSEITVRNGHFLIRMSPGNLSVEVTGAAES